VPDGPGIAARSPARGRGRHLARARAERRGGDFAGFVRILRVHLGYANIHTPVFPGGEIRGQVSHERDRDDDN